jgi:hypothetical protein
MHRHRMRIKGSLGSVLCGIAASALGTLAMDSMLYLRYRHDAGKASFVAWEFSEDVEGWEGAPAPALVARQVLESVLGHDVRPRYARVFNNVTHWVFGMATGAG